MMQITTREMLSEVQRWGSRLSDAVREFDSNAADRIEQVVNSVGFDRVTISTLGKAKRGKSTLVNALLGRKDDTVAPVDRLPASSCVSRFTRGVTDKAVVTFLDGRHEDIPFERIREFVTEEENPENRREVRMLDIEGQFSGIDTNVMLVDTPGAGSIHEHHDALLYEFIPQSDAVIFLVTARMPMDQDEKKLLGEIKKADIRRLFFVINRVDEADVQDLADAETHARKLLSEIGITPQKYYRISAKKAFSGNAVDSGVPELLDDIRSAIVAARAPIVRERSVARIHDAIAPVMESLRLRLELANQTAADVELLLEDLRRKRKEEMPRLKETLRSFLKEWDAGLQELVAKGGAMKEELLAESLGWVESAPTLTLDSFARDLPGRIHNEWLRRMTPALDAVQKKMSAVVLAFGAEMQSQELALKSHNRMAGAKDSLLTTAMDMGQGGLMVAAGAGVAAIPSLVATSATGWIGTMAGLATSPIWMVCGPVGAFVVAAGAFTAFQGWRLSKQRMRDRLPSAVRDYLGGLLSNLQNEVAPKLRKEGQAIADAAESSLSRQRDQVIRAVEEAKANKPSAEEITKLKESVGMFAGLLSERPVVTVNG